MTTLPDQFYASAMKWATLDEAARKLEEMRTAYFARLMKEITDKVEADAPKPTMAAAERDAKASQPWHDYLTDMIEARTRANEARADMETLRARIAVMQTAALWPQAVGEQLGTETERAA